MLLAQLAAESTVHYAVALAVLLGIIAAIMSTADSVLLSLSSILSKDILGKTWLRGAPEESLTRAGKYVSVVIMTVLIGVAFSPRYTLWGLIELKMELLVQAAPLFVLGATWPRLDARAAMAGLLAGTALAAGLSLAGMGKLWGWHAGLLGLLLNVSLCFALTWLKPGHPQFVAD
jgi:solute:Na+ symporter, SSS family